MGGGGSKPPKAAKIKVGAAVRVAQGSDNFRGVAPAVSGGGSRSGGAAEAAAQRFVVEEPGGEASAAAVVLTPGWTKEVSRSTGETYYRNEETGGTQWDPPIAAPSSASAALPSGWEAVESLDTGQTYYVNQETGELQFDLPTAPAAGLGGEDLRGTERTAMRCAAATERLEQLQSHNNLLDGAAVFMAAVEGSSEAIGAVCAADPACVGAQHPLNGPTALHVASLHGHTQCVDELLSWGADPCSVDNSSQTALHYASNQEEVLYALLSASAARYAVNIEAEPGRAPPLLYSAFYGNIGAISCLIDYGADVDGADDEGTTALHIAALNGRRKAVKLLVQYGASLKLRDSQGRTPYEVADLAGHEKVCKTLHHAERKAAESAPGMATVEEGEEEEEPEDGGDGKELGDDDWVERRLEEEIDAEHAHHSLLFKVCALYDYASGEAGDLEFGAGQIIDVSSTDEPGGGWWSGNMELEGLSITGIFPSNFVEAIADGGSGDAQSVPISATTKAFSMGGTSKGGMHEIEAMIEEKEQEMVAAHSQIAEWQSRATAAEAELERQRASSVQYADTTADSGASSAQMQELKKQLDQSRKSMQDERAQKAAELAALQLQLQSTRNSQIADEGLSAEAATLAQQRAGELAASQQQVAKAEKSIAALELELSTEREQRNSGQATAGQLQKKLDRANGDLVSCREEMDRLRQETASAAKAQATTATQIKQKQDRIDALSQAVAMAEATAEAQSARMKNLDTQYKKEWALRKKYYNELQDSKGNIRVYSRLRPLLKFEKDRGDSVIIDIPDNQSVCVRTQSTDIGGHNRVAYKTFSYNASFSPEQSQEEVFADAKDLVQSTIDGYNVCIFAYGQTGSGKTFTMYGTKDEPGMAPRTVDEIWACVARDRTERGLEFTVKVYMAELYLDGLADLLLDKDKKKDAAGPKLFVRKDAKGMVFIQNITEIEVYSAKETMQTLNAGSKRRHVTGTSMNAESSRSHMIFSVVIDSKNPQTGASTRGKISLVDMAGSERVKRSEVSGQGFKEAVAINKSLSALLDVIDALSRPKAESAGTKAVVPYRNHILTQLMSDSLGGNAKTLMFVNISPASSNEEETLGSLGYATRASLIKNEVTKQGDSAEVMRLKKIVERLSAEKGGPGGGRPGTRGGTPPPTRGGR